MVVSGHAEAGTKGNDIVCAAVSVLVTGAAEFWKDTEGISIEKTECGENICFEFKFNKFLLKNDVKSVYIFLIECLEMVAKKHPDHVSINRF